MHFLLTSSSVWRDILSHSFSTIAFWAMLLRDFPFGAAQERSHLCVVRIETSALCRCCN
ncbi:hypothetical protein NDI39_27120 [Microcoleus sp. ZQ-A2]